MNLGDGFARRKQITAQIDEWTNRLKLTGRESIVYQTKAVEGKDANIPITGSTKTYMRTYTIEECQKHLQELIEEDQKLALRISITNQKAKAKLVDLEGKVRDYTIPELLVLRNDVAPKMEAVARSIPIQTKAVNIVEKSEKMIKWTRIDKHMRHIQEISEKGSKIENDVVDFYTVEEVTDYGWAERRVFDEIDRIHLFLQRIKDSINEANKAELLPLP